MIKTICQHEEYGAATQSRKYFHDGLVFPRPRNGCDEVGDPPHSGTTPNPIDPKTTSKHGQRAFRIQTTPVNVFGRHLVKDTAVRSFVADLLVPELGRKISCSVADLMTPELIGKIRGLPRFQKDSRRG